MGDITPYPFRTQKNTASLLDGRDVAVDIGPVEAIRLAVFQT